MHKPDNDFLSAGSKLRRALGRPTSAFQKFAPDTRVILIGQGVDLHRALTHPAVESGRFLVVDTVDVDVEVGLPDTERQSVERLLETFGADAMLLAGPVGPSIAAWATDVAMAHGVPLWAVMPTEVASTADPRVVWPGEEPLLQLAGYQRSELALSIKRGIDILGALIGLVVSAPVLLVLAILIRIESRGWPLFRHTRVAQGGRRFSCLKLRTMNEDAEARLENDETLFAEYVRNNFKIPEDRDPRVTKLGRFLRRTSLDEVPQFWNVLVGDMSLVGPRPLVPEELEHYRGARQRLLLSMRPGLTGAWAVSGRHGVSYPERAEIELSFVRHWTLRTDIVVLFRTLGAVLSY